MEGDKKMNMIGIINKKYELTGTKILEIGDVVSYYIDSRWNRTIYCIIEPKKFSGMLFPPQIIGFDWIKIK